MRFTLRIILLNHSEGLTTCLQEILQTIGIQADYIHAQDASFLQAASADLILAAQPEAYTALQILRASHSPIPLVVYDALNTPENTLALQKAGAYDYIPTGDCARLQFCLARLLSQHTPQTLSQHEATLHKHIGQLALLNQSASGLFEHICKIFVEQGQYRMAWVGLVDPKQEHIIPAAWAGEEWGYLAAIHNISLQNPPNNTSVPAVRAIFTGQPAYDNRIENSNVSQHWQQEATRRGYHSAIALPLRKNNNIFGTLNLYMGEANFFTPNEIRLLLELCGILEHTLGTIEMNTIQLHTEMMLKHTRERLDFHLQNSPLAVIELDHELKITTWSGQAERMFGWQAQEVLGKHIPGLDGAGHPPTLAQTSDPLSQHTSSSVRTNHVRHKDGHTLTCQWHNSALYNSSGRLVSLQSHVLDISEQQRVQEALRENEDKFRLLVEHSPSGIEVIDSSGKISGWNHAQERLTGLSREEVIGRPVNQVKPRYLPLPKTGTLSQAARGGALLEQLKSGKTLGQVGYFESEIIRPDGSRRWAEINSFIVRSLEGFLTVQVTNDISARKYAEAALQANARQLELVFNANSDMMVFFRVQPNGLLIVEMFNQACKDFLQRAYMDNSAFLPGMTLNQLIHALALPKNKTQFLLEQYQSVLGECTPVNFEMDFDGTLGSFSMEVNILPVLNEAGRCTHILLTSRDITERRRIQNELNESNQRFYNAFELAASGMMLVSLEGNCLKANPAICRLVGYNQQELLNKNFREITHPADVEPQHLAMQQLQDGLVDRFQIQKRFIHKDGRVVFTLLNASLVCDKQTRPLYFIHQITDISAMKEAEHTLRLQSAALQNAANAIIITDTAGNIEWANPAWELLTGYSQQESYGQNIRILKSGWNQLETYQNLWNTILSGNTWQGELINLRKDGTAYTEHEVITPVKDERGQTTHFVAIKQDITERKRHEVELLKMQVELEQRVKERTFELQNANISLKKAARMKDEFLASMSHELRTPLTGILGLSEALQMSTYGTLTEQQNKILKMVESSGRHLLSLINDMLDLSKIEAGRLELQLEPCSLDQVCQSGIQLVKGLANQKKQKVAYIITPATIILQADARRLKQMLVNLLGNAIKFTPEGGRLGVEAGLDEPNHEIRITVWDEGIGIREKDQTLLFQPFVQLDSRLSRQYEGTGLGLSLVHRLADLHHGRIEVSSIFGKGSRFTIVLPATPQPEEKPHPSHTAEPETGTPSQPPAGPADGPLVLMADDNEMVLELMRDFLESRGYRMVSTHNGEEFLQKLHQLPPDLILMDVQMPGMDGLEVIQRVRADANPGIAHLPVIAMTALAMPGDRETCLQAGADLYLSKPVQLRELEHLMAGLLTPKPPAS